MIMEANMAMSELFPLEVYPFLLRYCFAHYGSPKLLLLENDLLT